jgi:predicted AAA+ superfamily ATPase
MFDMQHIAREVLVTETVRRLGKSPVVALLGARQVGKTTLAREVAGGWKGPVTVFDLERTGDQSLLGASPEMALTACSGLVIVDEVQRVPNLFERLRPICDAPNRSAVFLLLGSASLDLVRGISESLAGRIQFVDIAGFSLQETGGEHQDRLWFRGGFPRAYCADTDADAMEWLDAFSRTFLERDVAGYGFRLSAGALGRFWTMLAHYHGQTWNASRLAVSMDADRRTVNHYRDLLAGTFMIRVLPPWFENVGKRLVKSPKIYLRDSGMLHRLLGLNRMMDLRRHPLYGASWEGFALEQTLIAHGGRDAYFWATQRGAELDLLLLRGGKRWGFEFKCTDAPRATRSMHIALEDLRLEHLWAVYPGQQRFPIHEKITALPLREMPGIEMTPASRG